MWSRQQVPPASSSHLASGKTTLTKQLCGTRITEPYTPTMGMNIKVFQDDNVQFTVTFLSLK
jgi:hypothetical protein